MFVSELELKLIELLRKLRRVSKMIKQPTLLRRSLALLSVLMVMLGLLLEACSSAPPPSAQQVMKSVWANSVNGGTVYMLGKLKLHNVSIVGAPSNAPSLITNPNEELGGVGEFDLLKNDGSFTLDTPNFGSIELDINNGSFYMHFPGILLGGELAKRPWLYVDATTLANLTNPSLIAIAQLFIVMDPAYSLNYLKGFSAKVVNVGTAKVNGVSCNLYNYTINISQAVSHLTGVTKIVLSQAAEVLHTNTQNITSCVDSQGRVRSNQFTIALNNVSYPVPGQPYNTERLEGSMTITQYFNTYSSQSFITKAPPENKVENIQAFAKLLGLS